MKKMNQKLCSEMSFWSSYKRFGPVQTILDQQKESAVSMVNEAGSLNIVTSCIVLYIGYIIFVIAISMVMLLGLPLIRKISS